MAPVLAITSLVAGTLLYRSFDPVGEFLKLFVTGPNRILITTEENRDENGREAVAKSKSEEGASAAVAIGESRSGGGPSNAAGIDVGNGAHFAAVRPDRDSQPVRRFECFTEAPSNTNQQTKSSMERR
jgi:hypothetical protein